MSDKEQVYYSNETDTIWVVGKVEITAFRFDLCGSSGFDICWFLPEHLERMTYLGDL